MPMKGRSNINLPHHIQMMLSGSIPPAPIANLIGFKLVSIGSGQAVIEFEAAERHANSMGTLHGGVLCDVSDAAMGMAYASTLKASRDRPVSGHRQVRESVENERSAFALREVLRFREASKGTSVL